MFPLGASTGYPIPVVNDKGKFLGEIHNSTILLSMIQEREETETEEETTTAKTETEEMSADV